VPLPCFARGEAEKGEHPSLCAALAPFVLACKDWGRFPEGKEGFFSGESLFTPVARALSVGFEHL